MRTDTRDVAGPRATQFRCDDAGMALKLRLGEKVSIKGRTVTVTQTAYDCLPAIRTHLISVAQSRDTITYGQLCTELALPYLPRGLGRLMDLVSVDCIRRREPSLASLVVNQATGEVGVDFAGDPVAERQKVYRHTWRA